MFLQSNGLNTLKIKTWSSDVQSLLNIYLLSRRRRRRHAIFVFKTRYVRFFRAADRMLAVAPRLHDPLNFRQPSRHINREIRPHEFQSLSTSRCKTDDENRIVSRASVLKQQFLTFAYGWPKIFTAFFTRAFWKTMYWREPYGGGRAVYLHSSSVSMRLQNIMVKMSVNQTYTGPGVNTVDIPQSPVQYDLRTEYGSKRSGRSGDDSRIRRHFI